FHNGDGDPMDDHGHGTHCAGTIGAVGNNGIGVAGVCWNARIMALKFLGSGGSGSTADAISAVEYATLMKARLTSNSWGGGGFSQGLKDAIDAAGAADIAFIAAAGNDNRDTDSYPMYPACYVSDNIMSVVATDNDDARARFSNYGLTTTDLGAPGVSILSCLPGNRYRLASGTSMATPHVAGAYALLLSQTPSLRVEKVKAALIDTVDPTLPGLCVSGGRLNVAAAMMTVGASWLKVDPASDLGVAAGNTRNITVFFTAVGMAPGTYTGVVAIVSNDMDTPTVSIPVVMVAAAVGPVTCSITSPTNGVLVKAGTNLTITAAAASPGRVVSKVEFFRDGIPIAEALSAPYSCVWSNVPAGRHWLTARVTDEVGAFAGSEPVRVTATGLMLHWKLDETDGTVAADSSGGGNTGTLLNGATWTAGWVGRGALALDGANACVQAANSENLQVGKYAEDLSVAFWIRLEQGATGSWRNMAHKGAVNTERTFTMQMRPNNNCVRYRISTVGNDNEATNSIGEVAVNAWTHMAYLKSGNTLSLYLNGVPDSSMQLTGGAVAVNDGPLYLGRTPWVAGVKCEMDDVRVYNFALTADEVAALYAQGGRDVARPTIQSARVLGQTLFMDFDSESGRPYDVMYKTNLMDPAAWLPLTNNWRGTGALMEFADQTSATQRFYRVWIK
ncbi:MAG: S8 family serine peptidase, partial [Verrucomicrobiota bacterium]|nr:S8 family serine peptidase [Verrucomicrobiota bacterium]